MSLPDLELHEPAKKLASIILATAIKRKQKYQSILLLKENSEIIPTLARFNFNDVRTYKFLQVIFKH